MGNSIPISNILDHSIGSISNTIEKSLNTQPNMEFSQTMKTKFNLAYDEILLDRYSCALSDIILVQGDMYITQTQFIFYSLFNNRNLFGETVLRIPYDQIIDITKEKGFLGLNNTIRIQQQQNKSFIFTSFVFRDQCYDTLYEAWLTYIVISEEESKNTQKIAKKTHFLVIDENQPENQGEYLGENQAEYEDFNQFEYEDFNQAEYQDLNQAKHQDLEQKHPIFGGSPRNNNGDEDPYQILEREYIKEIQMEEEKKEFFIPENNNNNKGGSEKLGDIFEKLALRKANVLNAMPPIEMFKNLAFRISLDQTNIHKVFETIFTIKPIIFKNKVYDNMWHLYSTLTGIEEPPLINDWNGNLPKNLCDYKEVMNTKIGYYERTVNSKKPVNSPMIRSKFIEYNDIQRLYILDTTELIITSDIIFLTKFPCSDTFEIKNCWILKQTLDNEVTIELKYTFNFIKASFFKGIIEKSMEDEQKKQSEVITMLVNQMKNEGYFDQI